MPRLIPFRLVAACALALVSRRSSSPRAPPSRKGVARRACASSARAARSLAEETSNTGDDLDQDQPEGDLLRRRDRRQRQVGDGASGATALGLLAQASKSDAALRPLLVTDRLRLRPRPLRDRQPARPAARPPGTSKVNHKGAADRRRQGQAASRRRSALGPGADLPVPERAGAGRAGRAPTPGVPFTVTSSPTTKRASASRRRARR